MKNKFQRDLSAIERNVDDKIKRNQKIVDENSETFEAKVNVLLDEVTDKMKGVTAKMETVEPSEVIRTHIRELIDETRKEAEEATTAQG